MKMIKELFTRNRFLLIVLLLAFVSVADLFRYGIPPTHDGEYHVLRFHEFYKVLIEGNLYPRWAPGFNNGFGIPLFNYVYPLPNYIASFFHFFGIGFIDAFKLNMVTAALVGAVFMYKWAKEYWGEYGAIVSSVFYTYSPYHFLDIYVRGSVGEVWGLAIFPALLWSYLKYVKENKFLYLLISSISLALLILSHNILALIFFTFFVIYALFLLSDSKNKFRDLKNLGLITIFGLGLSAPFYLPAILETKYVQGLQIFNPTDNFPKLYQLVYSSWGYGFSGANTSGGTGQMSFQVGIPNLLVIFASVLIAFISRKNRKIISFFIFVFFVTIFFITPYSSFLWESLPVISLFQFPWRLLSLIILVSGFLAGGIVGNEIVGRSKYKIYICIALITVSVLYGIRYANAPFYHERNDTHYLTRANFTDGTNSPGDVFNTKYLNAIPDKAENKIEVLEGKADIDIKSVLTTEYKFSVIAEEDSKLLINTSYFPGWAARVDTGYGQLNNEGGKMVLNVEKGPHDVVIYLGATFIQGISYLIFALSAIGLTYVGFKKILSIKNKE